MLFTSCLKTTACFASSSRTPSTAPRLPLRSGNDDGEGDGTPDNPSAPLRVASVNKYGGGVTYFDLGAEENARERGTRAIWSGATHPRSIATAVHGKLVPALRTTFLPMGYPGKTPRGYLQFCIWSWIQDVSTQLRSVLATQKILEGVDVGRDGATVSTMLSIGRNVPLLWPRTKSFMSLWDSTHVSFLFACVSGPLGLVQLFGERRLWNGGE